MNFKYCRNCVAKMPISSAFCPNCGLKQMTQHLTELNSKTNYSGFSVTNTSNNLNQGFYTNVYKQMNLQRPLKEYRVQPPKVTYEQAWLDAWHNYATGHAYTSRAEYWKFFLEYSVILVIIMFVCAICYAINIYLGYITIGLAIIAYLASIIPLFAITVRRLRDAGIRKDVWIVVVILIGSIVEFAFTCMPSYRYKEKH